MRRRRNGIAGVSQAEYSHAKWNPGRKVQWGGRRPRWNRELQSTRPFGGQKGPKVRIGGGSGVLLGILSELVVDVKGKVLEANPARLKGLFLAWMPGDKALAIVRRTNGRPGILSSQAVKIHREFHNVAPQKATAFDRPRRDGSAKKVGLIRSLTYRIPAGLKSPEKSQAIWVHKFGDHGEEGHGPMRGEKQYSDSLKPYLLENDKGELFIQRRPGNRYDVTKWIYW